MQNEKILEGFNKRMENTFIYSPVLQLKQGKKYDSYDMVSLGLSVLLFIMESMLYNKNGCTYDDITVFVRDIISSQYNKISYVEAKDITEYLVRDNLLNAGMKHTYNFKNTFTGENNTYNFEFIETFDYNVKGRKVRLQLSLTGLDLLFKTKEFYTEYKISINQLYLSQQIERGIFDGALRTVEELELAVNSEFQRLKHLEDNIKNDVLNVNIDNYYVKQVDKIYEQLEREKKIFTDISNLIITTKNNLNSERLNAKDRDAIYKITKVENKLNDIIDLHDNLFIKKISVDNIYSEAIKKIFIDTFAAKINFETEIINNIVHKNLPLYKLKFAVSPLFKLRCKKIFNPVKLFLEQPIRRYNEYEDETGDSIIIALDNEANAKEKELKKEKFTNLKMYLSIILNELLQNETIMLSELLSNIKTNDENKYYDIINSFDFFSFLINSHQMKRINIVNHIEFSNNTFYSTLDAAMIHILKENSALQDIKSFELIANEKKIKLENNVLVSDYQIKRRFSNELV